MLLDATDGERVLDDDRGQRQHHRGVPGERSGEPRLRTAAHLTTIGTRQGWHHGRRMAGLPERAPCLVMLLDTARGYVSPDHVPDGWVADRPADIAGRQPEGPRLGYQGPDQGYADARHPSRPAIQTQPGERVDDALAGCTAIGLRRASMFGRAPVIHDLRIACTIWGFS